MLYCFFLFFTNISLYFVPLAVSHLCPNGEEVYRRKIVMDRVISYGQRILVKNLLICYWIEKFVKQ